MLHGAAPVYAGVELAVWLDTVGDRGNLPPVYL